MRGGPTTSAVRPEGISHQQGASYTVGVTRSGGGQSPGGEDDDWTTAPRLVVPGSRQKVDMDLVEDGFIGGGDEIDFRRVTFEKDGTYTIKLDDLRGSAKLTLYRVTGGGIVEVASVTRRPEAGRRTAQSRHRRGGVCAVGRARRLRRSRHRIRG